MTWFSSTVIAAVVFGLLDFLWLGKIGRPLYDERIGGILAARPNMTAAVLFYAIYVLGMCYFAIIPAITEGSLGKAALNGALLGFLCYATWNLTNLSVLKDFSASIVPTDMAWGTIATMLTSVVTVAIVRALPWAS